MKDKMRIICPSTLDFGLWIYGQAFDLPTYPQPLLLLNFTYILRGGKPNVKNCAEIGGLEENC